MYFQSDENVDLKMKVKHLQKEMEEKQIERADTINRLSKSLENSQKQCEQMLEAGRYTLVHRTVFINVMQAWKQGD